MRRTNWKRKAARATVMMLRAEAERDDLRRLLGIRDEQVCALENRLAAIDGERKIEAKNLDNEREKLRQVLSIAQNAVSLTYPFHSFLDRMRSEAKEATMSLALEQLFARFGQIRTWLSSVIEAGNGKARP